MAIIWGVVVTALALLCWGGQVVSLLSPQTAERLTLTESQSDVEPAFYADVRGEALWDSLTLWSLVVAGVLLIVDSSAWPYFGIAGGASYVYFAGRGVATRREMQRRGLRLGSEENIKAAYVMLSAWGVAGLITLVAAVAALA
ncbi:MAG: hypothetical protein GY720_05175 [bacterium]|nr:hypothetical protein [bacterium]